MSNGVERKGRAPFIQFSIENNIFIGIESTFSREMWENIKLNENVSINRYICDITYEDEHGWVSIITGKYNCCITRISDVGFRINFFVDSEDIEEINIIIDTNIEVL